MIGSIRGILRASRPPIALVECGGVGYEILAPMLVHARLAAIGEEVFLHTEMVVREDSQTLYGFGDRSERELFRRLIRISGVGAKMTLGMMNEMPAADIISALKNGDKDSLTRLPGIGRKTAERLVVELKDDNFFSGFAADSPRLAADAEVEEALAALGYKRAEIRRGLNRLPSDAPMDTASRVRLALRILSKRP